MEQPRITLTEAFANARFTSAEHFRREHEAIFYRNWTFVGHDCDLAETGAYITGYVADQAVFAIRGEDGRVRAFYNVCKHRGHRLLDDGRGVASRVLVCPYHAWSYELDGRLRGALGAQKDPICANMTLSEIRIDRLAGFWFVNLSSEAPALHDTYPGLEEQILGAVPDLPDYQVLCEGSFDIQGNWKICMENSLECYHCGPAHPGFCEILDLDNYDIATYGAHTRHWGKMKDGGDYSSWKMFPTTTLRSSSDGPTITSFCFRLLGPGQSRDQMTLYGPAAMAGDRDKWLNTDFLHEDIALIESVQTGMSSKGFPVGWLMKSDTFESEQMLIDFEAWVEGEMNRPYAP